MKIIKKAKGQSLVEFALILPLLTLLLFGLIDIGLVINKQNILNQINKEIARATSVGNNVTELTDLIKEQAKLFMSVDTVVYYEDILSDGVTVISNFTVTSTSGKELNIKLDPSLQNRTPGELLHVESSYIYDPITPLVDTFTDIPLHVEIYTRIESVE